MANRVKFNPMRTRADMIDAAMALMEPLPRFLDAAGSRLVLSDTTAHYDEAIAGMEGFSRVMWAIVPMLMGGVKEVEPIWEIWKRGIAAGVDPESEGYWGDIGDFDQRTVEMAVIGMGMCFVPERFFFELPEKTQGELCRWLDQINHHDMPKNNWKFFRILVNLGFIGVGYPHNEAMLQSDLDELETHYTRDGWYFDKPTQRDYYTLWGFHYYSLLYARFMRDRDPERCARFLERARLIAPRFACWFDGQGRALAYGRSQTYRFAQSSYWASMAFAGCYTEEITPGVVKGMLLRNLRYWFSMPIFDRDGVLTVGYGYPNLVISEGYNAPGSPYWSMKAFAVLALPENDPFWQSEEAPFAPPTRFCDRECLQLTVRDEENRMVTSYTSGNHAYEHMHEDEKYEKFAYSTHFGFSAVKESGTLNKGAFDSMLAMKRVGHDLWHARSGYESYEVGERQVACTWSPMAGVMVDTVVAPLDGHWHLRRHVVHTEFALEIAEAGFAVVRDRPGVRPCDRIRSKNVAEGTVSAVYGPFGSCAIYGLTGYDAAMTVWAEPNTNMLAPRTNIPTLTATLQPGTHTLCCAVYADMDERFPEAVPEFVLQCKEEMSDD